MQRRRAGRVARVVFLLALLAPCAPARAALDGTLRPLGCLSSAAADGCDVLPGLEGAGKLAVTPDGRQVLVPAETGDQLIVFSRDPATGALTRTGCLSADARGCTAVAPLAKPNAVAVAPDGADVYVAAQNALVVLHRDAAGTLTYTGRCYGGGSCAAGVAAPSAITARNDAVYVASMSGDEAGAFERHGDDLDFRGCVANSIAGCASSNGRFTNPTDIVVDSAQRHAYVSDYNTPYRVVTLDVGAGHILTARADDASCVAQPGTSGCGSAPALHEATSLDLVGDDQLYVTSRYTFTTSEAVELLDADPTAGTLTWHAGGCWLKPVWATDGCTATPGMAGPNDVVAGPDGTRVFASNNDTGSIVEFARGADGMLTQLPLPYGCLGVGDGCGPLASPVSIRSLTVSPDGRSLYAAGFPWAQTQPGRLWSFRIDQAPVCTPLALTTTVDTPVRVPLSCRDADGDALAFELLGVPAHGTLGPLHPDGTLTYTPAAGATGTESFAFRATAAGIQADQATATISIVQQPPPPPADRDHDGVVDTLDNCPDAANAGQADLDGDGIGDVCDPLPPGNRKPVAGVRAVATLDAGRVVVRLPSGERLPLAGVASLPVGTVVDARKGRLALETAAAGSARQRATISAGIFEIRQARARAHRPARAADLALVTPPGAAARCAGRKPARKGVVRTLSVAAKGVIRTVGRAGRVKGRAASWTTTDRCDGTLVHVTKGRVAVTALHRRRAVAVGRGRTYLIKARLFRARRSR